MTQEAGNTISTNTLTTKGFKETWQISMPFNKGNRTGRIRIVHLASQVYTFRRQCQVLYNF